MKIILALAIYLVMFIPFIMCAIVSTIIICLIKTKAINKTFKIIIIIIILLGAFIILNNFKNETPDNLYIEMKEINDEQSLIGLPKEVVVELLGEPMNQYSRKEGEEYRYDAGKLCKGLLFGNKPILYNSYEYYHLNVFFDETGKVKSTSMRYTP